MKLIFALFLALCTASAFAYGPSRAIPGRYIVVYKDSVSDPLGESDRMVRNAGGRRHHTYTRTIKGFAASLPDDAVERLRSDPEIAYIEQDQEISLADVEDSATWGLDRIDQADRPLDTQYHYNSAGAGVYAFIIDTGIRADHAEFTGRIVPGFNAVADNQGTKDCNGHGTHVSGTVGGTTYGIAKQVKLVPVRVLGCQGTGTWSGVIAGIDWVAGQVALRPAVANMSLGGARSGAINSAVARAVAAGVTMVVAAGNDNLDACTKSPASEPSAITVGATTDQDVRASFSNFGSCVDLFAPGVGITSAWNTGATDTKTISGTSMATPHVTGVAALIAGVNPTSSPAAISNFIVANATAGRVGTPGTDSPNLLLYSLATGTPVEPPPRYIAVKSLAGAPSRAGRQWRAEVTVSARDIDTGKFVAGAVVSGNFGTWRTSQCTLGLRGTCSITSAAMSTDIASTVFTVTDVQASGFIYDATQNAASQLVINRR
ncbi:MAG TPA: S8 family peptidase [Ramlibacter sp.]|nr:S8 family peptidase [Ramlibacter sp.]